MKTALVYVVLVVLWALPASCAMGAMWSPEETSAYCQILDVPSEPIYQVSLAYIPESRFNGQAKEYGKSAFLEINAAWDFAYFRDIALGDVDLNLRMGSILFLDSAGLQLPDQVAKIALDAGWTWRYPQGMALQVRAMPGIYSDIEAVNTDIIFMPVSCSVVRSFNPQLSGIAGLELRLGFDRKIMPIIGVEWEINDMMRLKARLPESRFIYFIDRDWSTHLGLDWQNTSFSLREKSSYDRKRLTVEDFRGYWGLTRRISDQLQFTGELGWVFDRSVEFKKEVNGQDSDIDIDSTMFVRFALGGPF